MTVERLFTVPTEGGVSIEVSRDGSAPAGRVRYVLEAPLPPGVVRHNIEHSLLALTLATSIHIAERLKLPTLASQLMVCWTSHLDRLEIAQLQKGPAS